MNIQRSFFVGAALLGALAYAIPSIAKQPLCLGASYALHQPLGDELTARAETLTITDDGQVSIGGMCPAAKGIVRATKKGTKISAKWDTCSGLEGKGVSLDGMIDVGCGTFSGDIQVKTPPFKTPILSTKKNGDSVRMVTYNVQQLPSTFNAGTSEDNAKKISERILAAGYDVVVLNEVFDEDVRDVFEQQLKTAFPYYVADLDGDTIGAEDSGLMLFSRFPFEDPIMGLYTPDPGDDCFGSDCDKVRFFIYNACDSDDCMAEKGVGYVRLRNPDTGTIYNVLFTHTQASYLDDDRTDAAGHVVTRQRQFSSIRDLIDEVKHHGGFVNFNSEPIFVLGDLNTDGDLESPYVADANGVHWEVKNIAEYNLDFVSSNGVFKETLNRLTPPLLDSWAVDNAPKDPSGVYDRGITNRGAWGVGQAGSRLDYILRSSEARICVQHMTIAHNLRWSPSIDPWTESGMGPNGIGLAGTRQLSDHLGVNADINLPAPYCRPVEALAVDPIPGQEAIVNGNLKYPGSIQWFRFDFPGTYSFAIMSQNGTDFRVYEADNLSTPISQYKNKTTTLDVSAMATVQVEAKVFHTSKAPFYVRVFNPNRTKTGDYKLIAMEHDCATKEFACALGPGEERSYNMLPTPPVNNPDEAWFIATPEALPNGLQQHLVFAARDMGIPAVFHLDLEDQNGASLGQALVSEADPQSPGKSRYRLELDDSAGSSIYMIVRRAPGGGYNPPYPDGARKFHVWWQTNLTILYGSEHGGQTVQVWCHEENDPSPDDGDDEIYLDYVKVDGTKVANYQFIANFDAGNQKSLEHIIKTPRYFFNSVEIKFLENDDTFTGDDDIMYGVIAPLPPEQSEPVIGGELTLHDQDGAGTYTVYYNLAHGFDK